MDKNAATNEREYWAEDVQSWFNNNREPDQDHNHVNIRVELLGYDPEWANLQEVFGDTKLGQNKPATWLTGQIEGYDPSKNTRFEWPECLKEQDIKR